MSEFVRKERLALIVEAITGLEELQRIDGKLSQTGAAALMALQRLYAIGTRDKTAMITHEEMRNPLAAAHRIIERAGITCGAW